MAENKQLPPIRSTRSRVMVKDFKENQNITFDLPLDTVLVGMHIRLIGSIKYAYTAGTPKCRPEGAFEALTSRIDVTLNGRKTIKSVTPHYLAITQLNTSGVDCERFAEAGATPIKNNNPKVEGGFVFGTTGQYTTIREGVYLPFEHVYCEPGMGRENTYLNLRRQDSAQLTIQALNFARLNAVSGVTGLTFSEDKLQIEVTLIERQDIEASEVFQDYKTIFKTIQINNQANNLAIDIPAGQQISGFMMYTKDGNAMTTTKVAQQPSSDILSRIDLKKNGRDSVQFHKFDALQSINKSSYGIVSPTVSGLNRLDGIAHLNMISRRDIATGFWNFKDLGVDSLQLVIDSNDNTIVDYTTPATLMLFTEEIGY